MHSHILPQNFYVFLGIILRLKWRAWRIYEPINWIYKYKMQPIKLPEWKCLSQVTLEMNINYWSLRTTFSCQNKTDDFYDRCKVIQFNNRAKYSLAVLFSSVERTQIWHLWNEYLCPLEIHWGLKLWCLIWWYLEKEPLEANEG